MTDTIRLFFTYGIASIVVLGGGAALVLTRNEIAAGDLRVIVAGFIGSALTFVFGSEVQARTARQSAAATLAAGVATNAATNGSAPPSDP